MSSFFKIPFKGHNPIKGFNKALKNINEFVATVGPSSIKSLRTALIEGDEEKALEIYLTVAKGGRNLSEDLQVSVPFPIQKFSDQTPLHLAVISALKDVVTKFLEFGGNPGATNAHGQTCLHCICSRSDKPSLRDEIVCLFLSWKGLEIDGFKEQVFFFINQNVY